MRHIREIVGDIMNELELKAEAEKLAGRPLEIVKTKDGRYVVEWFSYGYPPPPKSESELGALAGFVEHIRGLTISPEVEKPFA